MSVATKAAPRRPTSARYDQDQSFAWEGRDKAGKPVRGELRAPSEAVVRATLRRQGVTVSKVKKQSGFKGFGDRVAEKDITMFTRQLATMLKSGVPLLQSFDITAKGTTNQALSRLLNTIKADVETGSSLSQAFRKHPQHFDALFCNLVAAGEQAGILDTLLDRLATYKEKILAIKSKIKSAMFYPTAVVGVAMIVTAVILIFVIPEFKKVFSSFGADLPAPTMAVLAMSDAFVNNWPYMLAVAGAGVAALMYAWKKSPTLRVRFDQAILKAPVIGEIVRKAVLARWARTLSTMFAAGVPLIEALDSVGGAAGNAVYKAATRQIQSDVSTGSSLTSSMHNTGVFPGMMVQMVSIGEESGQLDTMLSKIAEFYEGEVDDAVAGMSSLLEPLIMVFLGTVIGGLVVAMYLPIFKVAAVV